MKKLDTVKLQAQCTGSITEGNKPMALTVQCTLTPLAFCVRMNHCLSLYHQL